MLTELVITNVAIIDKQSVSFSSGLNVLSGETGSGKSIILDSLELILGARASTNLIRTNAEFLEVQAHFDLSSLPAKIMQGLPEFAQGDELVISRSFNTQSKNKIFINGNLGTVALLAEIGKQLINICGQNQHVRLLEPKTHLELLDGYLRAEQIQEDYAALFSRYAEKKKELEDVTAKNLDREARAIWLEETLKELTAVKLYPGIRKNLEVKLKRHSSSQRSIEILNRLTEETDIVLSQLNSSGGAIAELERLDPESRELRVLYESSRANVDEFSRALQKLAASLDIDEEEFEQLSEDMTNISRLERKHKTDDSGLCDLLTKVKEEMDSRPAETLDKLTKEVQLLKDEVIIRAQELSQKRKKAAHQIEKEVEKELKVLSMKSKIKIFFEEIEPSITGIDRIEIQIAPNEGEQLKPLKQIASGGELSRILLVLKTILRERSGVNVLVFDEIDTGISGGVARAVGLKLKALADQSQVICITHLAQVASLADKHIVVDKKTQSGRTLSIIKEVSGDERVDEVARMISGLKITDASRASARELLKN